MKIAVSRINGLSEEEINEYIDVDAFEVTRLHRSDGACSAQSIFFQLYSKPIFESECNVYEALGLMSWCRDIPNVVFGNPSLRNTNSDQEKHNAILFFKEYVKKYNNVIAIEPLHQSYGTNFINTYREAVDFIESIGEDRVMINLDLGSSLIGLDEIGAQYVKHVHVSGQNLSGLDKLDERYYVDAISKLLDLGYDGYISLESLHFYDDIELFKSIVEAV